MSVRGVIAEIAGGKTPPQLLHACRLEVGGFDAFGIEAISDAFRCDPVVLDNAVVAENAMHFAAVMGEQALFADLYDGAVGRLWRAGRMAPHPCEPFVAVPFDVDLMQARGDVLFALSDHPTLAADAAHCIRNAGLEILAQEPTAWRSRAFCIRTFGSAKHGAALFAVYRMSGGPIRVSGFGYAVAIWDAERTVVAVDRIPAAADGRVRLVT